jgi:hypothetical protein
MMVTKNKQDEPRTEAPTGDALQAACQAHTLVQMVYGRLAGAHPWMPYAANPYALQSPYPMPGPYMQGPYAVPGVPPAPSPWMANWEAGFPLPPAPQGFAPYFPFPFGGFPR